MEQLLTQDLTVTSLLIAFILGLLTKRFIPWWVYEEMAKKLKEYEETAPELIEEMQKMMAMLENPKTAKKLNINAPKIDEKISTLAEITEKPIPNNIRRRSRPRARRVE